MKSAFLLAVVVSGCVVDGDVEPVETSIDESEVVTSNRISINGLTLDRTVLGEVAAGSLRTAGGRAPGLFATAAGREQFRYLVSCALGPTQAVTVAGVTYTGAIGIAPAWLTSALALKAYRWVSACVLARTNLYGVSVPISLRAPILATPAQERQAFTVIEGAFWGDVFTAGAPIRACASPLELSGSSVSTLDLRECAEPADASATTTKCGFGYAGDCSRVCVFDTAVGYQRCDGAIEVMTVYLAAP